MIRIRVNLAVAGCAGALAFHIGTLVMASADSLRPARAEMPIAELKNVYLGCERAALAGKLDGGEVMHCSIVYEELKRRVFGGDFKSLKTWSDSELRLYVVTG